DPNTAGNGFAGLVIVNKVDDPQKAAQGLNSLAIAISNLSAAGLKQAQMSIPTRQTKVGDISVTYLAAPLITPSWTIQGDKLFIALYPQVAATAAKNAAAAGKQSILDNPDYLAVRKRLGGMNATGMQYVDLRKTAAEGYQSLLMISRLAFGLADMWGVNSPEVVLPTYQDLMPQLAPMGCVSWAEPDGFHMRSVCPFPGSQVLAGSQGAFSPVIGSAFMASVMLPSLSRARETANRVKCASNMRQIGQAMLLYANEHKGAYPATMGELLQEEITPNCFLCPTRGTNVPPQIDLAEPAIKAGWVDSSSDYVYVAAGKNVNMKNLAESVVLYERPGDHGGDGINMLFGDGHVEFVQMGRAQAMIAQLAVPKQK
ncbi:MAG TPA: H-X9-DG-CTERM domain-containing protein, partial [Tepidisphaeraceae bacterium]